MSVLDFLKKTVGKINFLILNLISFFISNFFSKNEWYKMVLIVTYYYTKLKWLLIKKESIALSRAYTVNTLLSLLTRKRKNFPIPHKIRGLDQLDHSKGLILCTVHLPLIKVGLRGLIEEKHNIDAAIVGQPTKDGLMSVWGITNKIPTIDRNPFVLLNAKRILKNNGSIVLMIDKGIRGYYSPNIMHLCGKLESKLVFLFTELNKDGSIDSYFIKAPFPHCENEKAIYENLKFLRKTTYRILDRYKKQTIRK